MKNMKRAIRRHHRERMYNKRYHQVKAWNYDNSEKWMEEEARRRIHTPCACSCWMCGNPRKTGSDGTGNNSLTLQEYRNLLSFYEELEDIE